MSDYETPENDIDPDSDEEWVSRSQVKREMQAHQKMAERLLKLKTAQWHDLGFSQSMLDALEESKRIKSHIAIRRHIRRLAKLLSKEETAPVEQLFDRLDNKDQQENARFHRIEQWRDRLLSEGDEALKKLLDEYPNMDRQHIRQLVRAARKEAEKDQSVAARRKLFRYIREIDESSK